MNSFNRKNVAVIGGAGMIGTALCKKLLSVNASVHIIDNFSRGRSRIGGANVHLCDATSIDDLSNVISTIKPEYVFNLAAHVAGVEYNQSNQLEMYTMNTLLQTVPLLACERAGVRNFLQTSSVCVYGATTQNSATETYLGGDPVSANIGYSLAKRNGEKAVETSSIQRAVVVRPTNTFGIFDYYDKRAHVIPALIKKLLSADKVMEVNGSPDVVREFVFADDVADAMMLAMLNGNNRWAYNIGTGGETAVSIGDLVEIMMDVSGIYKKVKWVDDFDGGDDRRSTNNERIRSIGFRYSVSLRDGIEMSMNDYKWRIKSIVTNSNRWS